MLIKRGVVDKTNGIFLRFRCRIPLLNKVIIIVEMCAYTASLFYFYTPYPTDNFKELKFYVERKINREEEL